MQKLIVSLKESRYCPRPCFEPQRRATRPSRPSITTPAMISAEASSHRPSITYVIARKPTSAFARVITSAGETLRTQAIRHLRDRRLPRPHPVPDRDPQPAPGREGELDPRPDPPQTDALALLDLIPGPPVRDDPAGEDPRDLGEPEDAPVRRELPLQPLVRRARGGGRDRVAARAVPLARDDARHRRAVHVDVRDAHEDRDPPRGGVRLEDAAVCGGDDPGPDPAGGVPEEEQEREEGEAEGERQEEQGHPLEDQDGGGDARHDDERGDEDGGRGPPGDHGPRNRGPR